MAEHAETFRTEKIDAAVLPTLTDADLRELGLPLGDRKKLRAAIDALGTTPFPGAPSTPEPLQGAAPRAAAEQRHLTVMFCDIVDSTRLVATLELENLRHVVDAYQIRWRSVPPAMKASWPNSWAMACSSISVIRRRMKTTPNGPSEPGSISLARCPSVRTIDGLELACRIGIASGVVVVGEFYLCRRRRRIAVLGEAPNLAARLQAAAPRNGVIIAAGTRALVGNLFELKPIEPMALKGIGEEVPAWQVIAAYEDASRFRATRDPTPAGFIGRDAELALLLDRWTSPPPERDNFFCCPASPVSANPACAKPCFLVSSSRMPKSVCNARPITPTARFIRYYGISNVAPPGPRGFVFTAARAFRRVIP